MKYDFRTADNAAKPHVAVVEVESGETAAIVYIKDGKVDDAERLAELCVGVFNALP